MAQGSTQFHEDPADLTVATKDQHRAIVSLMEELEAIDWYNQRAEATEDQQLAGLLAHNRDEEAEHAAMLIEWVRRSFPAFGAQLRRYLFTDGPILEIEERASDDGGPRQGDLGIGALAGKEEL